MKRRINPVDMALGLLLAMLFALFVLPFIHVISVSLSDATMLSPGLRLWPKSFTISAYEASFHTSNILIGIKNSVLRSVIGSVGILLINSMAAYAIAKDDLIGVRWLRRFFILTMYVSGGIIPMYLLMRNLQLVGSFWVYIFPMLVTPFYMVLLRTYMESLPSALEEAARIDGAGYFTIYMRIVLPLSKPVLAAVGLFSVINHWNAMTDTAIYNSLKKENYTLQYVLYNMLQSSSRSIEELQGSLGVMDVSSLTLRMAITGITMLPILIIYPFMQKHFVSGLLVGAVKA